MEFELKGSYIELRHNQMGIATVSYLDPLKISSISFNSEDPRHVWMCVTCDGTQFSNNQIGCEKENEEQRVKTFINLVRGIRERIPIVPKKDLLDEAGL